MDKLSITPEELQQSLEKLNDDTLKQLSDTMYEATGNTISDLKEKNIFTPLYDLFDSIWNAVLDERECRRVARMADENKH